MSGACEGVCVEGMYCGVVIIIDGYRRFVVALIIKIGVANFVYIITTYLPSSSLMLKTLVGSSIITESSLEVSTRSNDSGSS